MRPKSYCTLDGCERLHFGRGFCQIHYSRWRTHGDPNGGREAAGAALAFFLGSCASEEQGECILWPFSLTKWGYGQMTIGRKVQRVHRAVCLRVHGLPPSPHHQTAHSCGNKACCNPNHLRWATRKENQADCITHGTLPRGEMHGGAKLTTDDVLEIRRLCGTQPQTVIAAMYGISRSNVSAIRRGKVWAHLP